MIERMRTSPMLIRTLLKTVESSGTATGLNVVAFSGGVDSSTVAACLRHVFPTNSIAAIGISPSLPARQLEQAELVAKDIDIPLVKVNTEEHLKSEYVENRGRSCYHCKVTLYSQVLESIHRNFEKSNENVILFNGTNKDDYTDPTRLGLIAAKEYSVASPLGDFIKDEVRAIAKGLGLKRIARVAASPCLRSRLALGVEASETHLRFVERAEDVVRRLVKFDESDNLRFRIMPNNNFRLEVDANKVNEVNGILDYLTDELSLRRDQLTVRNFRSGSVSK